MVKKGRSTVEVVDAHSNAPFKEYAKDNETYVEAEPDAQYFVRIHVESGALVQTEIFVDGKSLGYHTVIDETPEEDDLNRQNAWKGGDVGLSAGQTGPKMKGVMTKEGTIAVSKKAGGREITYGKGQIFETITLKYCSAVGLMMAGVLVGPVDPYVMARKSHEHKRGADAVTVDAESIPPPQKSDSSKR
jgi:hypothetical protein